MVDKQFIIPELPDTGTQAWEDMVDRMRDDLDSDMQRTKDAIAIEKVARGILKEQGRDFDAEFKKYKEARHASERSV